MSELDKSSFHSFCCFLYVHTVSCTGFIAVKGVSTFWPVDWRMRQCPFFLERSAAFLILKLHRRGHLLHCWTQNVHKDKTKCAQNHMSDVKYLTPNLILTMLDRVLFGLGTQERKTKTLLPKAELLNFQSPSLVVRELCRGAFGEGKTNREKPLNVIRCKQNAKLLYCGFIGRLIPVHKKTCSIFQEPAKQTGTLELIWFYKWLLFIHFPSWDLGKRE